MDAACSRVKMFIHEALEGEKKKKNRVSFKSRWNDRHFSLLTMSKCEIPYLKCIRIALLFFFTSIAKILQFSILIICKIGKHFSSYKISIQLIGIVFTRGINLSAPCTRIVEARRRLFLLTRAHTKAVNVEGV